MTFASLTRTPAPVFSDEQEFRLLFAATFIFVLASVVLIRIGRSLLGVASPAGSRRSLFAETKATGSSMLAMAFMG